jgi:hypothetical protein
VLQLGADSFPAAGTGWLYLVRIAGPAFLCHVFTPAAAAAAAVMLSG